MVKNILSALSKSIAILITLANTPASAADDAQWNPERAVRLIVPSPPGGGTDAVSRILAAKLKDVANWQVYIDNRPGGGNNIGLDVGAKSTPDGYTIVMGESSNLTINQFIYKHIPFNVNKDLVPVALVGSGPLVLVVRADSPYRTVAKIVDASRTKPLAYASSGSGTVGHLVAESFKKVSGADILHVPYKGGAPAITDVIGGQVDFSFASMTVALPMIKAGKLLPLAVTTSKRTPLLPSVPTMTELGYKDFDFYVFYGVVTPAKTPANVVTSLNDKINKTLALPEVKRTLLEQGVEVQTGSADHFGQFLTKERTKWSPIVKASGASVD